MDINIILTIIQLLIYVILGGLAIWFRNNEKVKGKVVELINTAEGMYTDLTKAGGQRFEWVVNSLYSILPPIIRNIIPKTFIETIVQNVFDEMEDFAKKQLDKATDKIIDSTSEDAEENTEDNAEEDVAKNETSEDEALD